MPEPLSLCELSAPDCKEGHLDDLGAPGRGGKGAAREPLSLSGPYATIPGRELLREEGEGAPCPRVLDQVPGHLWGA